MSTNQPLWRMVANLGDVNPIEYGGMFVYIDRRKHYEPEIEVLAVLNNDQSLSWEIYRTTLEPHTYIDGVLSDNKFHPEFPVWYADKIHDVAQTVGMEDLELINLLCSQIPVERAHAYIAIADNFGWHEFDSYARTYSKRSELPRRIRRYNGRR